MVKSGSRENLRNGNLHFHYVMLVGMLKWNAEMMLLTGTKLVNVLQADNTVNSRLSLFYQSANH